MIFRSRRKTFRMHRFVIFVAIIASTVDSNDVLESPIVTNFGRWGDFENCTDGLLVTGLQLKVEEYRRRPDNTALNAIRLFCGNIIFKSVQDISSYRGPFGRYRNPEYCTTYAEGFQLMSQVYQGRNKDDVAAINFKIFCADGKELLGFKEPSGHEYRTSAYTEPRMCEPGHGICGIQTQVEYHQGLGDDTALNNVRVKCCKVPIGVVPIGTSTSEPSQESTQATNEEFPETEQETQPVQDVTDATSDIEVSTVEVEVVTDSSTELVTEVVSTSEVTNANVTELNTESLTEIVTESNFDVTAESETEIVTSPSELVTEEVTELFTDAETEKVTEVSTESVHEAVTEITTTELATEIVTSPSELVPQDVTELPIHTVTDLVTNVTTELVSEEATTDVVTELATESVTELSTDATTSEPLVQDVTTELVPEVEEIPVEVTSIAPIELSTDATTTVAASSTEHVTPELESEPIVDSS